MKFIASICLAALLCGCVVPHGNDIVVHKSTVFGLDISYDGQFPHVRFGLVRYFYQRIPVQTNTTPIYTSHVTAGIGLTKQDAEEIFTVGTTNAP